MASVAYDVSSVIWHSVAFSVSAMVVDEVEDDDPNVS